MQHFFLAILKNRCIFLFQAKIHEWQAFVKKECPKNVKQNIRAIYMVSEGLTLGEMGDYQQVRKAQIHGKRVF